MDYFQLAYDAIEAEVAATFPRSSNSWSTIVPTSDVDGWGLGPAAWATMAKRIEAQFNSRISPVGISIPKAAIVAAGGRQLIDFQDYLAAKAAEAERSVGRRFNTRAAAAAAAKPTQAKKKSAAKPKSPPRRPSKAKKANPKGKKG